VKPFSQHPAVRVVERAIRRHRLLAPGELVVVAVSGGADSVFLLRSLHALAGPLRLRLHAAHFDHGWRGADERSAAALVEGLCRLLGVPLTSGRAVGEPVPPGESPEAAARRQRYAFLAQVARGAGAQTIATGHNEDDQLETALIAWLRGSGPAGLAAMPWRGPVPEVPAHEGTAATACDGAPQPSQPSQPGEPSQPSQAGRCRGPTAGGASAGADRPLEPPEPALWLVRPLLELPRARIRAVLQEIGQEWCEDPANRDPRLLRNRIRAELVPLLEALSPGFRRAMLRTVQLVAQEHALARRLGREAAASLFEPAGKALVAPRRQLLELEEVLRVEALRWAVERLQGHIRDLEWAHLDQALRVVERGRGGAKVKLSREVLLYLEHGKVIVTAHPACAGR